MFFTLFKKITGFDPTTILVGIFLVVIAAIVIPNYNKVMGFFGYDTREVLQDKLQKSQQNTQVAVDVNKENKKDVEVLKDTAKNTEEVIVDKFKKDRIITDKFTEIKEKKKKKVDDVASSDKPEEQKMQETSEAQITSLWDGYCSYSPTPQCAANASAPS